MTFDTIVVGGGPAGMFAAITAAQPGKSIALFERNDRLGKKLLITGKGRCNVTNNCAASEVLQNIPRNSRFLYSAMDRLSPSDVCDYFEKNGCPLKTERGNRVFPLSDKSLSILETLKKQLREKRVTVIHERALQILTDGDCVCGVKTDGGIYRCTNVVLATGGVSYPATGSTGDGYEMAAALGHDIVTPEGSLVPLESNDDACIRMQGLSLRNVDVKLVTQSGKVLFRDFGELLFTHFGVSGPTVLSASAHLSNEKCKLIIDLKPALDTGKLNDRIIRDLLQYKNRAMENALTDLLPRSMIPVVLEKAKIPADSPAHSLKKEQRRALVDNMKAFCVEITGKRPVAEAIITSGGVKVSQINPKTMESKLIKGLYFAGEIIDCDGYTGGFNLQIAWATAYTAGLSVKNSD